MNKVKQAGSRDNQAEQGQPNPDPQSLPVYKPRLWLDLMVTVVLVSVAIGGFSWLLWAANAFSDIEDGIKFTTESSIALALAMVAMAQLALYWSQRRIMIAQWQAMERQYKAMDDSLNETRRMAAQNERAVAAVQGQCVAAQEQLEIMRMALEPRLRVTGVRVENFKPGHEPVFLVSIINDSLSDANDVAFYMSFETDDGVETSWQGEQVVTVPAKGMRNFPIHWRTSLTDERFYSFNRLSSPVSLQVSGYFRQGNGESREFCYRYYPWYSGERPDGLDQFFPCDFNSRLAHTLHTASAIHAHTSSHVSIEVIRKDETATSETRREEDPEKPDQQRH
jgi:hypothetical protein